MTFNVNTYSVEDNMGKVFVRFIIAFALLLFLDTVEAGILNRQKRVIGGMPISRSDRPWLVSLKGTIIKDTWLGVIPVVDHHEYCGGSLLNDRWVLTAAHCFIEPKSGFQASDPHTWQVRLALNQLDITLIDRLLHLFGKMFGKLEWQLWERNVRRIIVHPQYGYTNKRKWYNDIALVELKEKVPSGHGFEHIMRIKLNNNHTFPHTKQMCMVTGWGCTRVGAPMSQMALALNVPVERIRVCAVFYTSDDMDHRLCAGYDYPAHTGGVCDGDSGGPLVCRDDQQGAWVQVGVVSFTKAGDPEEFPAVFTRVSDYVPWIRNTMHSR